jgi:hypothetical protein
LDEALYVTGGGVDGTDDEEERFKVGGPEGDDFGESSDNNFFHCLISFFPIADISPSVHFFLKVFTDTPTRDFSSSLSVMGRPWRDFNKSMACSSF